MHGFGIQEPCKKNNVDMCCHVVYIDNEIGSHTSPELFSPVMLE